MDDSSPILVTGASKGIGAAVALRLAGSGHDIWLNYRSDHAAAAGGARQIEGLGRKCVLLPFDVADEDAMGKALGPLLAEETPYGLVHNAGITRDGLLAMMPRDDWDLVLRVHLTGFFLVSKMVIKEMMSARRGRIVAIASTSGEAGLPMAETFDAFDDYTVLTGWDERS